MMSLSQGYEEYQVKNDADRATAEARSATRIAALRLIEWHRRKEYMRGSLLP